MEKQNKNARAKRKKADIQRVRTLVERARAKDPRVKAWALKLKADREAAKAVKKAATAEKYAKIAAEKKSKEDAVLAQQAAKANAKQDAKKEEAFQKKLLKKLRRKWNKFCEELDVDDDNVPELVEALGLEAGTAELTRLKQNNATADELKAVLDSALQGADAMKQELEKKRQEKFDQLKADKAEEEKKNVVPWTKDELSMLIKATKKYPGGSQRRWFMIGEMVNTLGLTSSRSKEECIRKAKEITNKQQNDIKEKMDKEAMKNYEKDVAKKAAKSVKKNDNASALLAGQAAKAKEDEQQRLIDEEKKRIADEEAAKLAALPVEWSASELRCLTRALVTFKASMNKKERWECIAEQLKLDVQSSKTPKHCKDKFKALRAEAAALKASGQKVSDVSTAGKRAKKALPEEAFGKKGKKGKKGKAEPEPEPEPVKPQAETKEPSAPTPTPPAAPAPAPAPEPAKSTLEWSQKEQKALEKALKKYPVSMDKKERWNAISKDVSNSDKETSSKSARKCMTRFKDLRAVAQRTAGLGKLGQKDPDWKLKKKEEATKAKGYFTTTQDPDERKKQKMKKDEGKKNKFKEAAKTQGTGKKKKKK
jgi:hypothetical protein